MASMDLDFPRAARASLCLLTPTSLRDATTSEALAVSSSPSQLSREKSLLVSLKLLESFPLPRLLTVFARAGGGRGAVGSGGSGSPAFLAVALERRKEDLRRGRRVGVCGNGEGKGDQPGRGRRNRMGREGGQKEK